MSFVWGRKLEEKTDPRSFLTAACCLRAELLPVAQAAAVLIQDNTDVLNSWLFLGTNHPPVAHGPEEL